jgi:predicted amidohydrolase
LCKQELFETLYFCKDQDPAYFDYARPLEGHPVIARFSKLAKELDVVLPFSYFEKDGNAHFNSLVVIDADGSVLDNYRKSHIPDGPGYQEKYYFTPGNTGFRVWDTAVGEHQSTQFHPFALMALLHVCLLMMTLNSRRGKPEMFVSSGTPCAM